MPPAPPSALMCWCTNVGAGVGHCRRRESHNHKSRWGSDPTSSLECEDVPVEKCEQVQRRVCGIDFLEQARSSNIPNGKKAPAPSSNDQRKKCKKNATCKIEKKMQCKNEPVQKCKNVERMICSNKNDLSKIRKKIKNRMCKNVCDYTYSCKDCRFF